jgi:hypothetical protein
MSRGSQESGNSHHEFLDFSPGFALMDGDLVSEGKHENRQIYSRLFLDFVDLFVVAYSQSKINGAERVVQGEVP